MGNLQCSERYICPRWVPFALWVVISAGIGTLAGLAIVFCSDPPEIKALGHYRPISNTVLYDDKGRAFASFALQRRTIAKYDDFSPLLYDAVLSIEDKNFEGHAGVDVSRILAAARRDIQIGSNAQGASTLTMQLARNLFLSRERTYGRKIKEIMLAIQIERRFTKSQIFTMYANQIYLGHGIYGFETGAEYYFGKRAKELTLEEAAMLAALPKAPNVYSPIRNPERALQRRNLVLDSMVAAGKISVGAASAAKRKPINLQIAEDPTSIAPYFVEDIRQYLEKRYGTERVHETGLKVYTTIDLHLQQAADNAVLDGLAAYERRHGWHGRLQNVREILDTAERTESPPSHGPFKVGDYTYAQVVSVTSSAASLRFGPYLGITHSTDVLWTGRTLPQLLTTGDLAYVKIISLNQGMTARVRLEEDSGAQGALVAIDNNGEIKAMVGGRDFGRSKFNRATEAQRQVGSSFKPYVYTAAIDQGASPDDSILDAPITFLTASGSYTPHNYDRKFEGPITLQHALAESRNIPAVKLAKTLGIRKVLEYARRFGINERIPPYLPVALGAADLTLMEQTSAFSTFPNDGLRAVPHYIRRVTDYDGRVLEQNYPIVQEVVGPDTARTMTLMLRDVVLHGTAVAASRLRYPVGGKTGTTNDFTDAWFIGFSPEITCGVWVGFDNRTTLGNKETGAKAALPIWIDFMTKTFSRDATRRDFPLPSDMKARPVPVRVIDTPIASTENQPAAPDAEEPAVLRTPSNLDEP